MTLVDMIVPSRSKTATAVSPAVSLLRSFMVLGRLPRLRRRASILRTEAVIDGQCTSSM